MVPTAASLLRSPRALQLAREQYCLPRLRSCVPPGAATRARAMVPTAASLCRARGCAVTTGGNPARCAHRARFSTVLTAPDARAPAPFDHIFFVSDPNAGVLQNARSGSPTQKNKSSSRACAARWRTRNGRSGRSGERCPSGWAQPPPGRMRSAARTRGCASAASASTGRVVRARRARSGEQRHFRRDKTGRPNLSNLADNLRDKEVQQNSAKSRSMVIGCSAWRDPASGTCSKSFGSRSAAGSDAARDDRRKAFARASATRSGRSSRRDFRCT